ncbi:hypothetical protein BS17DRAFT_550589 [Gyrodon lividus]|nr:hypothetical protein BS17DRAFT_550589 [Gyrodon lividus]
MEVKGSQFFRLEFPPFTVFLHQSLFYISLTMRVLSFIPAFLLAAASFVAAAPAPNSGAAVPSCVPAGAGSGSGNDAALQPIISIIANATTYIQPLSVQF